jgi:hypothetical protein
MPSDEKVKEIETSMRSYLRFSRESLINALIKKLDPRYLPDCYKITDRILARWIAEKKLSEIVGVSVGYKWNN